MNSMLRLALPVIISYLGLMVMGLVDLIAVGRVGAVSVGAVGIGNSIYSWFLITGIGLMAGLDYLVGHAHGAGRDDEGFGYFIQGVHLSIVLSLALTILMTVLSHHLDWLGINPALLAEAGPYVRIIGFTLLPSLLFNVFRQYLQAMGIAKPAMVILIVANVINALVNYVLVFGHWGAPALRAVGSGWATLASRIFMVISMAGVLLVWDRGKHGFFGRMPLGIDRLRSARVIRLGVPSALQMNFEVGVFALATALAARLSEVELAAHQIVLNIASVAFMVPLGVSSAGAVLVGQALGAGDRALAVEQGWRALKFGVGFMTCSCILFLAFPHLVLGVYTNEAAVMQVGAQILFLAGLFQIADGAQVVGTGILRGLGDTRTPMIANLCGHWLIGLPIGATLCFHFGKGIWGLWVGLASGLVAVAIALVQRWRVAIRRMGTVIPLA